MNKSDRIKFVKAMEFICRNINDEEIFFGWLTGGVADGDIDYGDLSADKDAEDLEYYIEDDNFKDLIECFLRKMVAARKSGGFFIDGICAGEREVNNK